MLKYLACAILALSLTAGPAFAQDTTSGTQETSGTKHHKKNKNKDKKADAGTEQKAPVALNNKTCPVSGQSVTAMGHPASVDYKGHTVSLCCDNCKEKFMADADKNLEKAKADAATK